MRYGGKRFTVTELMFSMNSSEDSRDVRETCSHFQKSNPKATLACLCGSGLVLVQQRREASCFLFAPEHFVPLFLLFHVSTVANEDDDRHADESKSGTNINCLITQC